MIKKTENTLNLAIKELIALNEKTKGKNKRFNVNNEITRVLTSIIESTIISEEHDKPISIMQIAQDLELPHITVKRNLSNLITCMKQSTDMSSGIFDILNGMTTCELKNSKSVLGFLDKLNDARVDGVVHAGILKGNKIK